MIRSSAWQAEQPNPSSMNKSTPVGTISFVSPCHIAGVTEWLQPMMAALVKQLISRLAGAKTSILQTYIAKPGASPSLQKAGLLGRQMAECGLLAASLRARKEWMCYSF